MKLTHLQVQNYRSLVDVDLEVRDLAAVIGPNGVGKTALLEVFQMLQMGSQEMLTTFLEAHGGLQSVLTHANSNSRLQVELTLDVESDQSDYPMTYRVELSGRGGVGHAIAVERVEWQFNPQAIKPFRYLDAFPGHIFYADPDRISMLPWDREHNPQELSLAQIPRLHEEPDTLRRLLTNAHYFGSLDVGQRSVVRLPQSLTPTTRPGPNGENLYSALFNLRALYSDVYDTVLGLLRQGFPSFDRLEFPVVGAGQVTLAWYEKGDRTPFYPNQLSEGTLRFLWLATVLVAPPLPARILLDEPEVSLHPELLKLLAGLLQQASAQCQVVVATHSPDLIRWLEPEEVLVADKEDGATYFTWADEMNLEEWLKEYSLSDLWLMGNLGGRP